MTVDDAIEHVKSLIPDLHMKANKTAIRTLIAELERLQKVEKQFEAVKKIERERWESAVKVVGENIVPDWAREWER